MLPVFLPTDGVMAALLALLLCYGLWVRRSPSLRNRWAMVLGRPGAAASAVVLTAFLGVATLDSFHYREALPPAAGVRAWSPVTKSALDAFVFDLIGAAAPERSYSAPFAAREFDKTTVIDQKGEATRDFQPLRVLRPGETEGSRTQRLLARALAGLAFGAAMSLGLLAVLSSRTEKLAGGGLRQKCRRLLAHPAARSAWAAASVLLLLGSVTLPLWPECHVLGTDAVGSDVLYQALKSIRTALVIGTLATLAALPFAVTLGIAAGYFKGWVDDLIQYVYTTLSSIPGVLLIAAAALMTTVFMDQHPEWWPTSLERADMRLFLLAVIIGVTGWSTLARLLRAETLRISTLDFVTAARAMGVSHGRIMMRHVLPNVLHIILIVTVLDFSGIVLYEAILSYVGVGVDPSMNSFGTMINAARSEMSRSPAVWWNLLASFLFMLALVLSANLFAASVRDAFDPRAARSVKAAAKGK